MFQATKEMRQAAGQIIRPLIFSHTGVRTMIHPDMLSDSDPLVPLAGGEVVLPWGRERAIREPYHRRHVSPVREEIVAGHNRARRAPPVRACR